MNLYATFLRTLRESDGYLKFILLAQLFLAFIISQPPAYVWEGLNRIGELMASASQQENNRDTRTETLEEEDDSPKVYLVSNNPKLAFGPGGFPDPSVLKDLEGMKYVDTDNVLHTIHQRRQHFESTCKQLGRGEVVDDNKTHLISMKSISACLPPKTGSTTLKQIFYYLLKYRAPFVNAPFFKQWYGNVHKNMPEEVRVKRGKKIRNAITAVFVREPYSRLFSAYLDKLFKPRLDQWKQFGEAFVSYLRGPDEDPLRQQCASDVTFAEFVRYIVATDREEKPARPLNPHFSPLSRQCGLCNTPRGSSLSYEFIGKMESFERDVLGLLEISGLNLHLPRDFRLGDTHTKWRLLHAINFTFTLHLPQPLTPLCISKEETLRRLWRIFQITSAISTKESFPLSSSASVEEVTNEVFSSLVLEAFLRSRSDPDLKRNRNAAMAEAYSTVPLADRRALQEIFHRDFLLFGYSPSIPEVFPENDTFKLDQFSYFGEFWKERNVDE